MTSEQIPNLLKYRGGPGRRIRLPGRIRGGVSPSQLSSRNDQTVQSTDTDAAVSRLSAVSLGYLQDPFAHYFVNGGGTRRLPLINRGTYTRTTALDAIVDAFLSLQLITSSSAASDSQQPQTKQIISLGAGTDTRYYRLRAQNRHQNLIYHEIDFPIVSGAKYRIIGGAGTGVIRTPEIPGVEGLFQQSKVESGAAVNDEEAEWGFDQPRPSYVFHPLDLRAIPSLKSLESFRGMRSDVPTLILSECCLCYLEVDAATDILKWFTDRIPSLGIVLYEPIGVDDAFGQMMVGNLAARGIVMPTVQNYKTLDDQIKRLAASGFNEKDGKGGAKALSIQEIWERWITGDEKERVDALEGLDEVEEWTLLAQHYAVVWGWRGDKGFEGWKLLR